MRCKECLKSYKSTKAKEFIEQTGKCKACSGHKVNMNGGKLREGRGFTFLEWENGR